MKRHSHGRFSFCSFLNWNGPSPPSLGVLKIPSSLSPHQSQETAMELSNARVAILVEQQYQEMEVWVPLYRLREAGCKVTFVGPEAGHTYPSKLGYPAKSDKAADQVSAQDFDALVIPAGFAPDYLRRNESILRLVNTMA